jgi:hypothetical protein
MPVPEFAALIRDEPWWLQWARERLDARDEVEQAQQNDQARADRVQQRKQGMGLSLKPKP